MGGILTEESKNQRSKATMDSPYSEEGADESAIFAGSTQRK